MKKWIVILFILFASFSYAANVDLKIDGTQYICTPSVSPTPTPTPPTPGPGDGSLNNPWKLNVACTGNLTAYGFNLNWSTQKTIPKGATRYFEVDPIAYTGNTGGTGVIKISVFDYDQSPNVRSTLIVINKNTGVQKATSLFSGAQATQYVRYVPPNPPDEKYIIKCTENGTKDQPLSVWWEFSSMTKPTDY
jgi:hypothetical protein